MVVHAKFLRRHYVLITKVNNNVNFSNFQLLFRSVAVALCCLKRVKRVKRVKREFFINRLATNHNSAKQNVNDRTPMTRFYANFPAIDCMLMS